MRPDNSPDLAPDTAIAALEAGEAVRTDFYRSLVGFFQYTAATATVFFLFRHIVPLGRRLIWLVPASALLSFWFAFTIFTMIRKPVNDEVSRVWEPISKWIMVGATIVVIITIWVYLPLANEVQRLILLVFFTMFSPFTVLTATRASQVDNFANFGPALSIAIVFAIWGGEYRFAYAAFAVGYSIFMASVGTHARNAFDDKAKALAHSVDLTRRLQIALAQVANQQAAKARFIASASHDLGQPLQAARLLFDSALHAGPGQRQQQTAAKAHRAFDTIERQLNQMLEHLRLEGDAIVAQPRAMSVAELISRVSELAEPAARERGVELRALASLRVVWADPDLALRALGNLVDNAIRHARARRILIGARPNGAMVRLWVIDDGIGILPEDRERLFDDYAQGSNPGNEARGGFGLGLGSTRRLARLLDGAAGVASQWGGGSAFWLDLPGNSALASLSGASPDNEALPDLRRSRDDPRRPAGGDRGQLARSQGAPG